MKSRLLQHLETLEESLIANGKLLRGVNNSTIVGTGREIFIREFLRSHLGTSIGIGTGEIISANKPHDLKNRQCDIVIYDTRFPKLALSEGLDSFLIESVYCTIEVKSTLNEDEYLKSAQAASELNYRWKLHSQEMHRPPPRKFVVAYDGPATMETVFGWMEKAYQSNSQQSPYMPTLEMYFEGKSEISRSKHVSSSLDGLFVLGHGFILMDSFRFRFPGAIDLPAVKPLGGHLFNYACADGKQISLACMFLSLMDIIGHVELIQPYMPSIGTNVKFKKVPLPLKI